MHVNNILKVISIRLDSRFPVAILAQDPDLELPPDDDGPELPCNDDEGLSLEHIIGNRLAQKYRRVKQRSCAKQKRKTSGGRAPAKQFSEFTNVLFDGKTVSPHSLSSLPVVPTHSSLKLLELFAGTGSVGEAFQQAGYDVVSLDITDKGGKKPTIQIDIMDWDFKQYPPGTFSVVWASPPCEHYSLARTTAKTPRDFPYYDALVEKTLETRVTINKVIGPADTTVIGGAA